MIDSITNTATWIKLNAKSNSKLTNGITGIENQPIAPFINIEIAEPETTLPNKRKHNEIGNATSPIIFIGSITGFGSINPCKYPPTPSETIPVPWITKNEHIASVNVTSK